jgi:fumarate reductase flavoprotein subunit
MHNYDERCERATRDIVSRSIYEEIRAGRGTQNGGVHISMSHLGPNSVRKQFKGMVERCADCGFDLAGGLVEVVPTAHYMMGGVVFEADCRTGMAGLFAAGEDTGGVHGANRLGGNGVANSTVFGGIAGDSMAKWVRAEGCHREPDESILEAAIAACRRPLELPAGDLFGVQEKLRDLMWEDVGIIRNEAGLKRALVRLEELEAELDEQGVGASSDLAYNLTWHDWLNLKNQLLVSRAITQAALARENSRGAHFREDHPEFGNVETSSYTLVTRAADNQIEVCHEPVRFTHVRPGETLIVPEQSTAEPALAGS